MKKELQQKIKYKLWKKENVEVYEELFNILEDDDIEYFLYDDIKCFTNISDMSYQNFSSKLQDRFSFKIMSATIGTIDISKYQEIIKADDIDNTDIFIEQIVDIIDDDFIYIVVFDSSCAILKIDTKTLCNYFSNILDLSCEIYIVNEDLSWCIEYLEFEDILRFVR
jgi:hypothetical protein